MVFLLGSKLFKGTVKRTLREVKNVMVPLASQKYSGTIENFPIIIWPRPSHRVVVLILGMQ